jgi:hypothetical protein
MADFHLVNNIDQELKIKFNHEDTLSKFTMFHEERYKNNDIVKAIKKLFECKLVISTILIIQQ